MIRAVARMAQGKTGSLEFASGLRAFFETARPFKRVEQLAECRKGNPHERVSPDYTGQGKADDETRRLGVVRGHATALKILPNARERLAATPSGRAVCDMPDGPGRLILCAFRSYVSLFVVRVDISHSAGAVCYVVRRSHFVLAGAFYVGVASPYKRSLNVFL
jgi:hypothetical protein